MRSVTNTPLFSLSGQCMQKTADLPVPVNAAATSEELKLFVAVLPPQIYVVTTREEGGKKEERNKQF